MNTVGIRELKAHLSRHLRRVRSGVRLLVTETGRVVATIDPVGARGRPRVGQCAGRRRTGTVGRRQASGLPATGGREG